MRSAPAALPGPAQVSTNIAFDAALMVQTSVRTEIAPRRVTLANVVLDLCSDIPLPFFGGLHLRLTGRCAAAKWVR